MRLLDTLERFFHRQAPVELGERLVVAFSGGPDSTALLWGLLELAPRLGADLVAAHLDHAADGTSGQRAEAAAAIAGELGVRLVTDRRPVAVQRRPGESPETAARRLRYAFLEEVRRDHGGRWIATAHHLDDQAETVLLRIRYGSGPEGLAGILPVRGRIVRPLLGLGRAELAAAVEASGLRAVQDPTNRDLAVPRNRVRHHLLPHLAAEDARLPERLGAIAQRARAARRTLSRRLERELAPRPVADGLAVSRSALLALPEVLRAPALALLHRQAGAPYPAGRRARRELLRQLTAADRVGCDCGDGYRWESRGELLVLRDGGEEPDSPGRFAYTLEVPGEIVLEEISTRLSLRPAEVAPWMYRGSAERAGLHLPLQAGDRVEIRNRRPGDRLRPLGAGGSRRLKEVLIDRHVPRRQRDRIPLLVVEGQIAWVPGVTIDHRFRLREGAAVWAAELEPLRGREADAAEPAERNLGTAETVGGDGRPDHTRPFKDSQL